MTELPEHRACRAKTVKERRGVEFLLNQWRQGDSNWRNLYIGTKHVGVIWEPDLPEQVIVAMNGDPERDERLRAEGRRQANNAGALEAARDIEAEIRGYVNRTGDRGVLEAVVLVREYIARGLERSPGAAELLPEGS